MVEAVQQLPDPRIVNYHNVTPPSFFAGWDDAAAHVCELGRRQIPDLAAGSRLGLADSRFNELELDAAGYQRTAVAPILLDTGAFERKRDPSAYDRLRRGAEGGTTWLFVGRLAPNKAQHDLVKAFAVYRRFYDPCARLRLVGLRAVRSYVQALEQLIQDLNVGDGVELCGSVPDSVLAAHYAAADVFVCLSEHEGFLVPLLEAFHHRLPVVAFAAAAVPETLGRAGLLLDDKSPVRVAAAVQVVARDESRRAQLAEAGIQQLDAFALPRTRAQWKAAVESLLDA